MPFHPVWVTDHLLPFPSLPTQGSSQPCCLPPTLQDSQQQLTDGAMLSLTRWPPTACRVYVGHLQEAWPIIQTLY